jgi:hypothetical protein
MTTHTRSPKYLDLKNGRNPKAIRESMEYLTTCSFVRRKSAPFAQILKIQGSKIDSSRFHAVDSSFNRLGNNIDIDRNMYSVSPTTAFRVIGIVFTS